MSLNPFEALGLPERPDLTDEQVRAAWRKIAAATHSDDSPARTRTGSSAHSSASARPDSSSARAVKHRYSSPRNPASTRRARSASGRSPPHPPVRAILEDTATASIARCLNSL